MIYYLRLRHFAIFPSFPVYPSFCLYICLIVNLVPVFNVIVSVSLYANQVMATSSFSRTKKLKSSSEIRIANPGWDWLVLFLKSILIRNRTLRKTGSGSDLQEKTWPGSETKEDFSRAEKLKSSEKRVADPGWDWLDLSTKPKCRL